MLLLFGCTSIQWNDANGRTHHLGLVAARLETGERGSRIRRYAIGVDVRLSGQSAGVSVGYKRTEALAPRVVFVDSGYKLTRSVVSHMNGAEAPAPPRTVKWMFFHFSEDVTGRQTMHGAGAVGLDVEWSGPSRGINLGYNSSRSIVGDALSDNIVQITSWRSRDPASWELTLWALTADRVGSSDLFASTERKRDEITFE